MQGKAMMLMVALAIIAATGLGIWSGPPLGEETAKQLRAAAKFYDDFTEGPGEATKGIQDITRLISRDPIALKYAPAETAAIQPWEDITVKALNEFNHELEILADKFRKAAPKN